jgi:hypothetical protein
MRFVSARFSANATDQSRDRLPAALSGAAADRCRPRCAAQGTQMSPISAIKQIVLPTIIC